jgi:short-subunit dehydrogenase
MNSSFFASVNMTRELVKRVSQARIINVISNVALETLPSMGSYVAAKAAARYFFQALQKELPVKDYQITNLYPSLIDTHAPAGMPAIDSSELAKLILQQAETEASYYQSDITLHPVPRQ